MVKVPLNMLDPVMSDKEISDLIVIRIEKILENEGKYSMETLRLPQSIHE